MQGRRRATIALVLVATIAIAAAVIGYGQSRGGGGPATLAGARASTIASSPAPLPPDNATPPCAAPTPPAPTFPTAITPGQYGIPFVASLTHGQLIFFYNQDPNPKTSGGIKQGFNARLFNLTGWATGLIALPTLAVSNATIVFCDRGRNGRPGPIHFVEEPGTQAQIQNWDPSGPNYFNLTFQLSQVGAASLNVAGVEPDGALDLRGSAQAITSVVVGPPQPVQTCRSSGPTAIPISTSVSPMPPGGNPVVAPGPLTGPLSHAVGILGADNFSIPAFISSSCIWANVLLNPALGGLNRRGKPNWSCPPCPPIAGQPGWTQFFADTTITSLGLPVGPPPNFHF